MDAVLYPGRIRYQVKRKILQKVNELIAIGKRSDGRTSLLQSVAVTAKSVCTESVVFFFWSGHLLHHTDADCAIV